jgi:hypothetical protein
MDPTQEAERRANVQLNGPWFVIVIADERRGEQTSAHRFDNQEDAIEDGRQAALSGREVYLARGIYKLEVPVQAVFLSAQTVAVDPETEELEAVDDGGQR